MKADFTLPQIAPADLTSAINRVIKKTPKIELGEAKLGVKEKRDQSVIQQRPKLVQQPQ